MRELFGSLISLLTLAGALWAGWVGYQAGGGWAAVASFLFILIFGAIGLSLFDLLWRLLSRLSRL